MAEDVRYYGQWMRDEAEKRIGHLYPKVKITTEMVKERPDLKCYEGKELTVIAWLWVRTVKSPNPAYTSVDVPLVSTFMLSTKSGKEAYIEPVIEEGGYRFTVKVGKPKDTEAAKNGTKLSRGANFQCLLSGTPIPSAHIYSEANAGCMGARLMAIVAEGDRGRVYLAPTLEMESIALQAQPTWKPELLMPENPRWFSPPLYGLKSYGDLFTPRQLVALTTFSDLVKEAHEQVKRDALAAKMKDYGNELIDGSTDVESYADAVAVYLAFAVDKIAARSTTICAWEAGYQKIQHTFGRQAIPMMWDYAEGNPFSGSTGNFNALLEWVEKFLHEVPRTSHGHTNQQDASTQSVSTNKVISTDPPYYDNIGYADLSDFFYIWLRRSLKSIFPDIFATLAVPKDEELVATPYRHGNKEKAEAFFLSGMTRSMYQLAVQAHPVFPVTIYYAFKQSDTKNDDTSSTGWETFLDAVIQSGFSLTGTWPMRTELSNRMVGMGTNALASSIVLVCRKRPQDTTTVSRKEFLRELEEALPEALDDMIGGKVGASPIAPVDLAQAAIGPGMAVFSKYKAVLEADGSPMSIHNALILINKAIDEYFTHAESDMDADTRFCVDWFQQYGFKESAFGEADVLARAKGTSVEGVCNSGVLHSKAGKVSLLKITEYPTDWNPSEDTRVPIWEALHHIVRTFQTSETAAGALLSQMQEKIEPIRQLAYRLYTVCERKGWAEEARLYNTLIASWHNIQDASRNVTRGKPIQDDFDAMEE